MSEEDWKEKKLVFSSLLFFIVFPNFHGMQNPHNEIMFSSFSSPSTHKFWHDTSIKASGNISSTGSYSGKVQFDEA